MTGSSFLLIIYHIYISISLYALSQNIEYSVPISTRSAPTIVINVVRYNPYKWLKIQASLELRDFSPHVKKTS